MTPPKPTQDEVEAAIAAVQDYWDEGHAIIVKHGDRLPYTTKKQQKLTPSEQERRRKARKFAQVYTEQDLTTLFQKCREQSYAVTVGHIDKLSTIADRKQREAVQRRAIENQWSRRDIDRELRRRYKGSRNPGAGRKVKVTGDTVVDRLCEWCGQWDRIEAALTERRAAFTPSMQRRIKATAKQVAAIATLAAAHRNAKPLKPLAKIKYDHKIYQI